MIRLAAFLAVAMLLALMAGEVMLSPLTVLQALTGQGGSADFVVWTLRAPRIVTGALAGAALGLSGAIFQALLRNPLASPDVMGFTAGSGLGAVATVAFLGAGGIAVTLGAATGGLLAALLLGLLSWQNGLVPVRVVLVGIGVAFTLTGGIEFLMMRLTGPEAGMAARWLSGSLAARNWGHAAQIALSLAVLAVPLALLAPGLRLLALGDDLAAALGLRVGQARLGLALVGVGAAAAAVAVAGPVGFVALLSAPVARRLAGQKGAALGGAALVGATVVVLADLAARTAVQGVQLPLGVMTGLLGAPYLLWLLSREIERGGM